MGSVDELLAGLLASERRTEELIAALLDETACEESSDDEDEAEEMRILQDVYDKVCKMEARLCVVAARLEEVAAAELQQQLVEVAGSIVRVCMPGLSKLQWHPFSAMYDPYDARFACVYIAKVGDWTGDLYSAYPDDVTDVHGDSKNRNTTQ